MTALKPNNVRLSFVMMISCIPLTVASNSVSILKYTWWFLSRRYFVRQPLYSPRPLQKKCINFSHSWPPSFFMNWITKWNLKKSTVMMGIREHSLKMFFNIRQALKGRRILPFVCYTSPVSMSDRTASILKCFTLFSTNTNWGIISFEWHVWFPLARLVDSVMEDRMGNKRWE